MKIFVNFLFFFIAIFKALEKDCGYYSSRGDKVEKTLDDCYSK